jgi:DNA-binding CsgD family transcriptional regulator
LNANLSYTEHARNMGIAEDTFRNHLRAIFSKLGASNITYALVRAIQLGIIPSQLLSPAADSGAAGSFRG